ncbi:MAG: VOC family protein [Caulobacteraceae bacterium]|nr:VOC family protein [Caulobacteraceae bacterium]
MSDYLGQFVWYELMTSDLKGAEAFYTAVLGWTSQDTGMNPPYVLVKVDGVQVGGLMPIPERAAGAAPVWFGYVAVPDVDAYAAKISQAGGSVHRAPDDIPGVGRFAMVADPGGAVFVLFKGDSAAPPPQPAPGTPGLVGWRELLAGDGEVAFEFYSKLFGWTEAQVMDMGPMGAYRLFAAGGEAIGAMMTKPSAMPLPPHWRFYFRVEDIDAGLARVKAHGGQITMGPERVPTGDWIVHAMDPQGAFFALVGPRK